MHDGPPTPNHRRLIEALAGTWRSEELAATCLGGQLDQPRWGRLHARAALAGRFVISDYVQEQAGAPVFAGHGIYGWDGVRYTMQWFDSDADRGGEVVPGRWTGDALTFTRAGSGRRGRYEYLFAADGSYRLRVLVGDQEAGWTPVLVGTFRRVDES